MQACPEMSTAGDHRPRTTPDLSPLTLGLASLGSVVATVMVSRFGLAGSLAGAALAPVVIAIVRELGRRPVERVVRLPSGARAIVERRPRVRPRTVAVTAVVAFAVAVAAFTIPDMIAGTSVVSDRPSTFFSGGGGDSGGGTTTTTTTTEGGTVTAPPAGTVTAPDPEVTAPTPTTTAPPATTTAPPPAGTTPVVPAAPAATTPDLAPPPTSTAPAQPPG